MTNRLCAAVSALALALATSACFGFERRSGSPTAPSAAGGSQLLGVWTSDSIIPSAESCTDFKWEVTEQSANTAAGNFSATCASGLKLQGRASGVLSGSDVMWTATGTASAADLPSCAISLSGTAKIEVDQIRVPYSGMTCLGPVSGVEILKRK